MKTSTKWQDKANSPKNKKNASSLALTDTPTGSPWTKRKTNHKTTNNMKTPIPNLGEFKPKEGKKMIYCGTAAELFETHPYIKFSDIDKGLGYPEYHYDELGLFLTKKDYKRLNVRYNGIPWSIPDVPKEITDNYDFEVKGWKWDNDREPCKYTFWSKTEGWNNLDLDHEAIPNGFETDFFIKLTPKTDLLKEEPFRNNSEYRRGLFDKLYEALKYLVECYIPETHDYADFKAFDNAEEALAKAEGKEVSR